jgi:hypothetical protein
MLSQLNDQPFGIPLSLPQWAFLTMRSSQAIAQTSRILRVGLFILMGKVTRDKHKDILLRTLLVRLVRVYD